MILVRWKPFQILGVYNEGEKVFVPKGCDLVLSLENIEEQMGWDITRLPESEYENMISYFEQDRLPEMLELHDKYKLSSHGYCCGKSLDGLKKWIEYGIKELWGKKD